MALGIEDNEWEGLKDEIKAELEQTRRELDEIDLMLEQSQLEVGKLAQRNAAITGRLQQVQVQFDALPRKDIRSAYDAALEAQQRLFVMRGQVEKLQSDQQHIQRYAKFLGKIAQFVDGGAPQSSAAASNQSMAETVETMIEAQEGERLRLSRQMHDGPAQALSNFILQTEIAMRLFDIDQAKAREELANLKMSATSAFQKVRDFIFELRPMMLDDLGLAPTLKRFVDAVKDRPGVDIRLTITGQERRLEPYQEVMVFRAAQELIGNALRHSQGSQIKVQVDIGESNVKVLVDDNGKGFDVGVLQERGRMGVRAIRERVDKMGGYMEVDSVMGRGTRVNFQIPAVAAGVNTTA
ncbi:MAG: sensor histidine kinase [Chloroflexi bacterium]|nr:sensor histidine kinase [Chloroflexota bacterium]